MNHRFTNFRIERDSRGVVTAWIDVPDRGHNVFTESVVRELYGLAEELEQDKSVRVVIFRSAKASGFLAGADVSQIEQIDDPEQVRSISELGQQLFDRIEKLPMPTLAVIHGPCLGGGLEFALSCRYRIARDDSKTRLGVPEIELGILPAWGGTQRLPRQVGLSTALGMILQGQKLAPRKALKAGLVERIAAPQELDATVEKFVAELLAGKAPQSQAAGKPLGQKLLDNNPIGRWIIFRNVRKRTASQAGHYPAVPAALDAVEAGFKQSMAEGLKAERDGIARLLFTPTCRSLIGLFFQRERARSGVDWISVGRTSSPSQPADEPHEDEDAESPSVTIGVIGGGVMGGGIAQLAAAQGFPVILREINQQLLDAAMDRIREQFETMVKKGSLRREEADAALARFTPTVDWEPLAAADIVIEAATEREDLKRQLFVELDRRLLEGSIIATNTSALSVSRLAEATSRPGRVAGLHFFNPVHRMQLVEVVQTAETSEETTARLIHLVRRLGKTPIVTADSPGFLVNRVLFPYLNEGIRLVCEGTPADVIDRDIRRFGMPMGPIELLDQVGLDVAAHVAASMSAMVDDAGPSADLLRKMVEAGRLGKKSGSGFYEYKKGRRNKPAPLDDVLAATGGQPSAERGARSAEHGASTPEGRRSEFRDPRSTFPERLSEIQLRLVLLFINEAARCLEERIVTEAWMVDLAMVFGTGYAPFRGGPLKTAEQWGFPVVAEALESLQQSLGPRFAPCRLLRESQSAEARRNDNIAKTA